MKIYMLLCLFILPILASGQAQKAPVFPAGAETFFNTVMGGINTKHVQWIKSTARQVNEKKMTDEQVKIEATNWAVLGNINEADIEALCFLVLMQAAKSAQGDLKAIMDGVKALNNAKAKQREVLGELQKLTSKAANRKKSDPVWAPADLEIKKKALDSLFKAAHFTPTHARLIPGTKGGLDEMVEKMKADLDSMSEMGEMESLRLQMAMDRMSKMMSTLSNLLKKISDTANQITQNLK
jgi:hypothetical protein